MRRLIRIVALVIVVALIAGAAYIWRDPLASRGRAAWAAVTAGPAPASDGGPLIVSGVVEAQDLDVAPAIAGRIRTIHVSDGDQVVTGQPIAQLDAALLDAQIEAAAAAVQVAQAQVNQVRAGPREADLGVARAAVAQAEAGAVAAHRAAEDARKLVDAPAALDVQIARAEADLQVATAQVDAAAAAASAADLEQQLLGRIVERLQAGADVSLPAQLGGGTKHVDAPADKLAEARLQWNLKSQAAWEAHAQQVTAAAAQSAARQALADLRSQKAQPVTLEGQALAAEAAAPVADAAVETATTNLKLLQAGAPPEQIAVAEAAVARAEASQRVLEAKRPQVVVLAPASGEVSEVVLHEGEVAGVGAPIVRLGQIDEATLTVYVPQARMGSVRVGGPAAVAVDAFPGRTFPGTVASIAGEAEFTPKNVQTRAERGSTVFAVKIVAPNPDGALRAGAPADAFFCPGGEACQFPFDAAAEQPRSPVSDLIARMIPQPTAPSARVVQSSETGYAGSLEATAVRVAAEVDGRAAAVTATEGDNVAVGQVLVTIEGEELAAQAAEAEAAIAAARADLARIEARPQPERVAQAEAGVKQAQAAVAAAKAQLEAARAQRDHPQELEAQINSARQQIATATAAVDSARAQLKSAQVLQESLPDPGSDEDKTRRAIYDAQAAAATAGVRAAEAQQAGAKNVLAKLSALRANPVALDAGVHKAEGNLAAAEAAMATARAVSAQVTADPPREAVLAGQARVAQAEAGRRAIAAAEDKLKVASPIRGQVTAQAIHTGEVVVAGAPLFTVADLGRLHLRVYVPVADIGAVRVGQDATVIVDAYPGRAFPATVTHIAEKAEFTPKNVQTAEERARMVIPVELTLDNADGALRPGMGAEARW